MNTFEALDTFAPRHIGPRGADREAMLEAVGAASLDQLIDEAIPSSIRLAKPLSLPPAESESTYLARLETIGRKNVVALPVSTRNNPRVPSRTTST